MSEVEKLRELLAEARSYIDTPGYRHHGLEESLAQRIDAALAEPVVGCARCDESEHAMHMRIRAGYDKTVADSWRAKVAEVESERDEARAEVERLRGKAIRFDLDKAGIESRERDAVALVEARAEVERLNKLLTDSTVIIRETVAILASVVRQVNGGKP